MSSFDLVLPKGSYTRANGNLPPFELVNMFVEATPSVRGGLSLMSFPGLETTETIGTGAIRGIFRKPDLFDGALFVVSGITAYRDGVSVGAGINGSAAMSFGALNTPEIVIAGGDDLFHYNGSPLSVFQLPGPTFCTAVTSLAARMIYAQKNSYRFYWSDILDANTIDPLSYASAESTPGHLVGCLAVGDSLYLPKTDAIEVWYPAGDADLPYTRITQRTAQKGVAGTGAYCAFDNAFHFVGDDRCVYRFGDVPQKISHPGIDEALAAATSIRLFPVTWEGKSILYAQTETQTFGFDVSTNEWHERRSYDQDNWIVGFCEQQADGSPIFASRDGNDLYEHSGWQEDGNPYVRRFTAALPLSEATRIDSITIDINTGSAPLEAGTNPEVVMFYSRDRGNTWSSARAASIGAQGEYSRRVRFNRLGMCGAPGLLLAFEVSDPVGLRVSGAFKDESAAGPSRRG